MFSMIILDMTYMLYIFLPTLLLAMLAQAWVKMAYASANRQPAPLSGAAAARRILDSAGLNNVDIEMTPGHLSDHYDPRDRVVRLSPEVYEGRTLAAVGIAAHEVGHAIQHATSYAPLVIRNMAVPTASFGSSTAIWLIIAGIIFQQLHFLLLIGIILFSAVVFFQLVNLPVEFNASSRAKEQLAVLGIVNEPSQQRYVRNVLSAAAMTYVAATITAVLQLMYFIMIYLRNRD